MRPIYSVMFFVTGVGLAGCAGSGPTSGAARPTYDDCFFASVLRDWRPLDDENLIVFAGGRPYHIELFRPAFGLSFDVMIGVYDRDGMVCPYGGDAIVVPGPPRERIPIRSIKRLSDAELDEIYVRFAIRPPAVIEATEVDPEETSSD